MPDVQLAPDMAAEQAAAELSARLLDVIEANLPGALEGEDDEALHDLRVAVRRTRALQRELKRVFPPTELARFREDFRWVQRVTGPTRDLDVYLAEFGDFAGALPAENRDDLAGLRRVLDERRARERTAMEAALRSQRTHELLDAWGQFIERLSDAPVGDRPHALMPIGEVAAARIDRVYRQMVRMGRAIDDESPHSALHDLRKKGKELRYLLEFFSSLFPREVIKPMVRTLKALQDMLGRFQDREVQAAMVGGLQDEVAARDGGDPALAAMQMLIDWLQEDQAAARADFSERFDAFSAADQRALVRQTFRHG